LPFDSYALRARLADLRYRVGDIAGDAQWRSHFMLLAASVVCLASLSWLAYRLLPENRSIVLSPSQAFAVQAGSILMDEDDKYRFAEVGVIESEEGSVRVAGTVRSAHDLEYLRQRLEALGPPGPLEWQVTVQAR
jgi:hypothetical protein